MPGSVTIQVHMLDDTVNAYEVKPSMYGNTLLQAIMKDLDILESDYFGASFDNGDGLCFLDPLRQIGKQIKKIKDTVLQFGVKFFTPDPSQIQDEYTRYLFALQVKRDINVGTLPCAETTALEIASNIVQAEFGDWNAAECSVLSYLDGMKLFPNPTTEQLQKISELHRNLKEKKPADADLSLLEIARRLELYGVRLFPAMDAQNSEISLGVSHAGVLVFQGTKKINNFNWARIRKLSFKKNRFLIKLRTADAGNGRRYGDILIFVMKSRDTCKNFWRLCIEHHAFFRLEVRPKVKPKPVVLSRGSSFHYNGKTQKELLELVRSSNFRRSNFIRTTSRKRMHNSVSRSPPVEDDAKQAEKPNLQLQNHATDQSNNATSDDTVTSPSASSTFTDDQASYRIDDCTDGADAKPQDTSVEFSPDSGQTSPQMPEWQLESKSLHSSARPIEGTDENDEEQRAEEVRGKADIANYAWDFENQHAPNGGAKTVLNSSHDQSPYCERMRRAFKNSRKNDSNVESVETLLQNVSATDRHSIISNTPGSPSAYTSGGKSLSFDPLRTFNHEFVPPLPPKERHLSSEDGNYDNLKGDSVVSSGEEKKGPDDYVSSSGFSSIGDRKDDPFVNDSVVNLAAMGDPMTPEIKAMLGEQKIQTGHYAVPKKPPAPPEGEVFNSPRWNRTSQILDKEINEAMTQLYQAINDTPATGRIPKSEADGGRVYVDGNMPVVISSSDDEMDSESDAVDTELSPENDPILAPIKMEFNDTDSLFTSSC